MQLSWDPTTSFGPDATPRILAETFVRTVELHIELPSTSDRALARAAEVDLDLPLIVLADRQTAGRGRGDHRWWAGPGALTFSLLVSVDPRRLPARRRGSLSPAAGLAVAELLSGLSPAAEVGLKWPNDVHLAGRKCCGILVEAPATAGRVVVGIGLNVNNTCSDAPAELRDTAVALCEAAGRRFDLVDVLVPLVRRLESQLDDLAATEPRLSERWSQFCLLRGRTVHVAAPSGTVAGVCQGIDDDGALLLRTSRGLERILSATSIHCE